MACRNASWGGSPSLFRFRLGDSRVSPPIIGAGGGAGKFWRNAKCAKVHVRKARGRILGNPRRSLQSLLSKNRARSRRAMLYNTPMRTVAHSGIWLTLIALAAVVALAFGCGARGMTRRRPRTLGRVDTSNLTRRRKGRKDAIIALLLPIFTPSFPRKRESRDLGTAFVYHPSPKFRTSTASRSNVNTP